MQRSILIVSATLAVLLFVALTNFLIIKFTGTPVPAPEIPRGLEVLGTGKPLVYVVMGDSTTIAQGADYDDGYVRGTARRLAGKGYEVHLHNLGVSGATARDVATDQLPGASKLRPDIVLIAVGANDVTHLTRVGTVKKHLAATIDSLRAVSPDVRIVLTGTPQMGSVPRFPEPTRLLARFRTASVNKMAEKLAEDKQVTFAPIADKTGPTFDKHPELYAADKFHPNREGYALWTPVLDDALQDSLSAAPK